MSFVTLYRVSSTGPDDGHRLAAFNIVSSFGMTNCSRTLSQNFSSGDAGVGGSFGVAPRAQARSGVTNGTAPPMARILANSRRFMKCLLNGGGLSGLADPADAPAIDQPIS